MVGSFVTSGEPSRQWTMALRPLYVKEFVMNRATSAGAAVLIATIGLITCH